MDLQQESSGMGASLTLPLPLPCCTAFRPACSLWPHGPTDNPCLHTGHGGELEVVLGTVGPQALLP